MHSEVMNIIKVHPKNLVQVALYTVIVKSNSVTLVQKNIMYLGT